MSSYCQVPRRQLFLLILLAGTSVCVTRLPPASGGSRVDCRGRRGYDGVWEAAMSITVELGPELEERLRIQAAGRGVPVPQYVEDLLGRFADSLPAERPSIAEFE